MATKGKGFRAAAPWAVLTLLLFGASAVPSAGSYALVATQMQTWTWYATATSASSGAALSSTSASASNYYSPDSKASLSSGLGDSAARLQGKDVAPVVFESAPLEQTIWLNLSADQDPEMTVWWSWTGAKGTYANDEVTVRMELWIGAARIAGADQHSNVILGGGSGSFYKMSPYYLGTETSKLPAGEKLILKVYRLQGSGDFLVGTGADHQSFVRLRGFLIDPLAGALYLEGGKLVSDPYAVVPTREPADPSSASSGFAALLLPFLRRRGAPGAAALLLVAAFSGCLSSSPSTPASTGAMTQASVVQSQEARTDLEAAGHGAVEGTIRDELGIGVRGAHVALPGTNVFTDTNARGEFRFPNVTAGRFLLRVDATGYPPLERYIEIEDGNLLKLTVYLVKNRNPNANLEKHTHDQWQGRTKVPLMDADFLPASSGGVTTDGQTYHCWTSYWACGFSAYADVGSVVLPGATRVEIIIDLPDGLAPDHEVSLQVNTGKDTKYFAPRTSGTAFNVAVFPDEADVGHQKFSSWTFQVRLREINMYSSQYSFTAGSQAYSSAGKVHVTATAYKGVVPYEAPHKDLWKTKTFMQVVKVTDLQRGSLTPIDFPCDQSVYYYCSFGASAVLPGTKELRGTFSYATYQYTYATTKVTVPAALPWGLLYRTADIPPGLWRGNLKPVTLTANSTSAGSYDFTIEVKPGEEDQFYGGANWAFYLDDNEEPLTVGASQVSKTGEARYGNRISLTVTAFKDPNWTL